LLLLWKSYCICSLVSIPWSGKNRQDLSNSDFTIQPCVPLLVGLGAKSFWSSWRYSGVHAKYLWLYAVGQSRSWSSWSGTTCFLHHCFQG
jgi:hypothetical protein